jgi:hypothetical protein
MLNIEEMFFHIFHDFFIFISFSFPNLIVKIKLGKIISLNMM